MHVLNKILLGITIIGLFILQGCNNNGGEVVPLRTGVVVVNAGSFGNANGSISLYDEKDSTLENYVVKNANGGSDIGSGIESILGYGDLGIIVCNSSDKLEYIDLSTMKYVANPTTELTTPRYMAAYKDKGYITCWGPWSANWTLDESYVAVLDIPTKTIIDSIECGSGPEGILMYDNKLYIANSYDSTITVYDVSDGSQNSINLDAAPQHMIVDANKVLWVTITSGFGKYSTDKVGLIGIKTNSSHDIVSKINIPGIAEEGTLAYDDSGHNIYILSAQPWPGIATYILVFNTDTKKLYHSPIVSGENFSGLGFNSDTHKLYVADAAGFQGNGKIKIYNTDGDKQDEKTVAIGPTFFLFK